MTLRVVFEKERESGTMTVQIAVGDRFWVQIFKSTGDFAWEAREREPISRWTEWMEPDAVVNDRMSSNTNLWSVQLLALWTLILLFSGSLETVHRPPCTPLRPIYISDCRTGFQTPMGGLKKRVSSCDIVDIVGNTNIDYLDNIRMITGQIVQFYFSSGFRIIS